MATTLSCSPYFPMSSLTFCWPLGQFGHLWPVNSSNITFLIGLLFTGNPGTGQATVSVPPPPFLYGSLILSQEWIMKAAIISMNDIRKIFMWLCCMLFFFA